MPVVFHHRRLVGVEGVGLYPAETEAQAEVAMFGCLLLRTGIVGQYRLPAGGGGGSLVGQSRENGFGSWPLNNR
jgi:hypothetical protein